MKRRRFVKYRKFAVLALGVLAFAAAGCGGDDSSSEAAADTQVQETATVDTTTTAEDTTAEDTTAEDTTAEDTTAVDTTESTDTSGDVDLGDLSGDCLQFAGVGAKIAEAMGGANADISKTADLFDELVSSAPDEIKGDLQVIADGVTTLAAAMKGIDFKAGATPSADQLAKMQTALASVDSAKLQAASQHIEAWAQVHCKK
jgi:hypothetical protein